MSPVRLQLDWPRVGAPWMLLLIGGTFLVVGTGFGIHSILCIQGASYCEGTVMDIGSKQYFVQNTPPQTEATTIPDKKIGELPSGTTASITPRRESHPNKRGRGAVPEVRYFLDGIDHTIFGRISTSPSAYAVGQKVTVYYFPEHPEDGVIGSFVELWLFPVIFGGLGLVLTLAGAFAIFWKWTHPA